MDKMADKARLHRSELAVPGTNVRAMEKAPTLGADLVFLDLEDAVAPDDKEQARANVIEARGAHDWSGTAVSVRIKFFRFIKHRPQSAKSFQYAQLG